MEVTYNPHDEAPVTLAAVRRAGLWGEWAKLLDKYDDMQVTQPEDRQAAAWLRVGQAGMEMECGLVLAEVLRKLAPQVEVEEIEWASAVLPWYRTVEEAVTHHRLQAKALYRAAKNAADRREPADEVERLRALAREHTAFARRIESEGLDVTRGPRPTSY